MFAVFVLLVGLGIRVGNDDDEDEHAETGEDEVAGNGSDPYAVFDDKDDVSLLCIEELRVLCESDLAAFDVDVTVEPGWTTTARLADGGELGADAWLTVRPFDQAVAGAGVPQVLARSPIALVGPPATVSALDAACPDVAAKIGCAVATRGEQLALQDPSESAFGALAAAVAAFELGVATDAVTLDERVATQLADALDLARITQSPFDDVARVDGDLMALTAEADLVVAVNRLEYEDQERYDDSAVRYPLDVRALEIVAVPAPGFARFDDLHRVLSSTDAAYSFDRMGFFTDGGYVAYAIEYSPVFDLRPQVRTDLPPPTLGLLRDIAALGRSG